MGMRRRDFLGAAAGAALVLPLAARAQQPSMPIIGYLSSGSPAGIRHAAGGVPQGLAKDPGFTRATMSRSSTAGPTAPMTTGWLAMAADLVRRQARRDRGARAASTPRRGGEDRNLDHSDRVRNPAPTLLRRASSPASTGRAETSPASLRSMSRLGRSGLSCCHQLGADGHHLCAPGQSRAIPIQKRSRKKHWGRRAPSISSFICCRQPALPNSRAAVVKVAALQGRRPGGRSRPVLHQPQRRTRGFDRAPPPSWRYSIPGNSSRRAGY